MAKKRRQASRTTWWQRTFHRRDFLIATYTTVLGWGLNRYFSAPVSVAQLPPITGTLTATLEPVTLVATGVVRFNTFVAVDSVGVNLGESASVERV